MIIGQQRGSAEGMGYMIIERKLGGYFKWIVVDDGLTIIDPHYREEYETSVLICMDNLCYS